MFVVTSRNVLTFEIKEVHGIVYNEPDFDRFIAEKFKGAFVQSKQYNLFSDLSISYLLPEQCTIVVMEKIEEVGQPVY